MAPFGALGRDPGGEGEGLHVVEIGRLAVGLDDILAVEAVGSGWR